MVVVACWVIGATVAVIDAISDRTLGAVAHFFIAAGATLFIVARIERVSEGWLRAYEAGRQVSRIRSESSSL